MQTGRVVLISGPAGAGKTSVARELARASAGERAVHLHTDDLYAAIVKGFVDPRLPEAHYQNTVVVEAFTAAAKRFALGGFEVVVDGVVGPWFLEPWQALVREGLDVHYLVLRPDERSTLARGTSRTSASALVDPLALSEIWRAFADLGSFESHALDTTSLTLEQTLAQARDHLRHASKRLRG